MRPQQLRIAMLAMALTISTLFLPTTTAQDTAADSLTTTTVAATTTTTATTTTASATVSPSATDELGLPVRTPGPAVNIYAPGTINCLTMPYCKDNEECFVLKDGLVCLESKYNWGYILARNDSGVPAVPSWSGPRSAADSNCSTFQLPGEDRPGLSMTVYDLIQNTYPKDLLLSQYDRDTVNWYTLFSNCEASLTCYQGKCNPRPTLGQSCFSSWQCNSHALGLDDRNSPILSANMTQVRCEYEDGDKSINKTCQALTRETAAPEDVGSGFSAWHVIVPVVLLLVVLYFATVFYQRRMRKQKLRKWSRRMEAADDGNNFHMETYDEIR